jgi:UDP-N-acetylglucosamine pyrophosphorylase
VTHSLAIFCSEKESELPQHIAKKKIAHINAAGELVKPTTPNGERTPRMSVVPRQACCCPVSLTVMLSRVFEPISLNAIHLRQGIKMEKFVFDVFAFADRLGVMEVRRATDFSPLKNGLAAGKDNRDTCQRDLYALHRQWLLDAGVTFVDSEGKEVGSLCELRLCLLLSTCLESSGVLEKESHDSFVLLHGSLTAPPR